MKNKAYRSEDYNFSFDAETGFFARWGATQQDDPQVAPFPEIADIEIGTTCNGLGKPCKFCSPAGAKVSTAAGDRNIEDLKTGDKVYSVNFDNPYKPSLQESTIAETYKRPYKGKLIRITLESGETLLLTPEHDVILKNGVELPAGDLKVEHELISVSEFKSCKHCNAKIVWGSAVKRFYCSDACYQASHNAVCLICGSSFTSQHKNGRYCCVDPGPSDHPLSGTYQSMLDRCYDPLRNVYPYYGGKGVRVAKEWFSFDRFVSDMGDRPEGYSLDRIDSNENYGPSNCRWATLEEQRVNRSRFRSATGKYKGVRPNKNKWVATVRHKGESHYLGSFSSEREAAEAYNSKMKEFYPHSNGKYENKP